MDQLSPLTEQSQNLGNSVAADPGRAVHAGKTAEVTIETDTYQILVEDGVAINAPRTTSRDVRRHKSLELPRPAAGDV